MKGSLVVVLAVLPWLIAASAGAAAADGPARPVVTVSNRPVDVARLGWISEEGRKALDGALGRMKSGESPHFAFAAGALGDFWALRSVGADSFHSREDLARQALEACEYLRTVPCALVAVDGRLAGSGDGSFDEQPSLLADAPVEFDPMRVPFVPSEERTWMRAYRSETTAKAFAVTTGGAGLYRTADTMFAAVATTMADCASSFQGQDCILYAVKDRVVFDPVRTGDTQRLEPVPPPPEPVIGLTDTPVDPAAIPWLTDKVRASLTRAIADLKAGRTAAFAFAAAPRGDISSAIYGGGSAETGNRREIARQALESCEYLRDAPCFLVSVNGFEARHDGDFALQPWLLRNQPVYFDPLRVPFSAVGEYKLAYHTSLRPRAFGISHNGYFVAEEADTVTDAIAAVERTCRADQQLCYLYAVNERVVWSPYGSQ